MSKDDKDKGELVREGGFMLPNGNGVYTKVYRGKPPTPPKKPEKK